MNNYEQLLTNLRKHRNQYSRREISIELRNICEKVNMFVNNGYTNYIPDTYIQTSPRAPLWFRESLSLIGDDGGKVKISYRPDVEATKNRTTTVGKFINFCVEKMGLVLTPKEVAMYGEWAGVNFKVVTYTYEIVRGGDVARAYRNNHFGSCMSSSPQVMMYTRNPEVVGQLVVSLGSQVVGRCLIWNTSAGTLVDRIYPSDEGAHVKFIKELAQKEGWDYKDKQTYTTSTHHGREHVVRFRDPGTQPYIDTLRFIHIEKDDTGDWMVLSTFDGPYKAYKRRHPEARLHEADNQRARTMCAYYGQKFNPAEFVWAENLGEYISYKAKDELFTQDASGNYILRTDIVRSKRLDRFLSRTEAVQLTYGAHTGDWVPADYPWLISVEGQAMLRQDAAWSGTAWAFAGINLSGQPPLTYQGVTEGDMYFDNSNGVQGIVRVTSVWKDGVAANVGVSNIRNDYSYNLPITRFAALLRPTAAQIESYLDVFAFGDIVLLTEPHDGTVSYGVHYPVGTLGFVKSFDERTSYCHVYLRSEGSDAVFFHAVPTSSLRRVARRGSVLTVGSNVTGFTSAVVTFKDALSKGEIIIEDGGQDRTMDLATLIKTGIFGTQEQVAHVV